ncbi:hypothetical protein LCGC14_1684770 [marine sediment metagenome]|uniref:UvrD-like helicase C-terminal domain-containing protein n=1 Tax=marine sediment metagenome TaxID=412755 RepID=A0A0F9IA38_9ZZZZ
MKLLKFLLVGLAMLTLSACATFNDEVPLGSFGQKVAESVVDVSKANRDLRICWMAAGAIEVMTDLAQRGGNAQVAFGSISLLQGAIDKARNLDPFWAETDAADVTLLFANALKAVEQSRLSQAFLGGPSIGNFLNMAKRTVVLTVKGRAVIKDINRVLRGVEDGTIDKVVGLGQRTVKVEIEHRTSCEAFEVEPVTWEQYRYEYDPIEDRIVAKVVGRYMQIPLMLAWAVTIHKAQGKTLDGVFVDLGNRAFASGQVYVALSRVRSLEDLRIARPIREEEVRCDPNVTRFYLQLMQMTQITEGKQENSPD